MADNYEIFKVSFSKLLEVNGGYFNDPDDNGKQTRYGITEDVARRHHYEGEMKNLPLEVARDIYLNDYWNVLSLHEMDSWHMVHDLFVCGVNVGTTRTATWLQECLNVLSNNEKNWSKVVVDGVVGKETIKACNDACSVGKWEKRLVKIFNCVQGNHYKTICEERPKNEKFIGQWLDKRVLY